jgi:hypothetical protein
MFSKLVNRSTCEMFSLLDLSQIFILVWSMYTGLFRSPLLSRLHSNDSSSDYAPASNPIEFLPKEFCQPAGLSFGTRPTSLPLFRSISIYTTDFSLHPFLSCLQPVIAPFAFGRISVSLVLARAFHLIPFPTAA